MKYFALILMVVLTACTSSRDKLKVQTDEFLKKSNQLLLQGRTDQKLIDSTFGYIESFVTDFPNDTLSPAYLFEKALLQEKMRQFEPAIATLDRIYTSYPKSPQANKSVFLQGYLYANVLNDYEKAKAKYQLYLDEYADVDSKMTGDAQMELKNLGKSPDEILKEILEKSKADTTQAPA